MMFYTIVTFVIASAVYVVSEIFAPARFARAALVIAGVVSWSVALLVYLSATDNGAVSLTQIDSLFIAIIGILLAWPFILWIGAKLLDSGGIG